MSRYRTIVDAIAAELATIAPGAGYVNTVSRVTLTSLWEENVLDPTKLPTGEAQVVVRPGLEAGQVEGTCSHVARAELYLEAAKRWRGSTRAAGDEPGDGESSTVWQVQDELVADVRRALLRETSPVLAVAGVITVEITDVDRDTYGEGWAWAILRLEVAYRFEGESP